MNSSDSSVHALLYAIGDDLSADLTRSLLPLCSAVECVTDVSGWSETVCSSIQVVFCEPDVNVVGVLRSLKPDVRIIVVSRQPEVSVWLDSIEAGASDYCAAPFDALQMKWMLNTSRCSAPLAA